MEPAASAGLDRSWDGQTDWEAGRCSAASDCRDILPHHGRASARRSDMGASTTRRPKHGRSSTGAARKHDDCLLARDFKR